MPRYLRCLLFTDFMTLLYRSERMVPKGTQYGTEVSGSYSCTFYIHIYSRLPRPGTMNEVDTVYQEPEGMVHY